MNKSSVRKLGKITTLILILNLLLPVNTEAATRTDETDYNNPIRVTDVFFEGMSVNQVGPLRMLVASASSDYVKARGTVDVGIYIDSEGVPRFSVIVDIDKRIMYVGPDHGTRINKDTSYTFYVGPSSDYDWGVMDGKATKIRIITAQDLPDKILNEYTNTTPTITVTEQTQIINNTGTITISGNVTDPDTKPLTISATINNITKTQTIQGPAVDAPYTLTWTGAELATGNYNNIPITVNDTFETQTVNHIGYKIVDKIKPKLNISITK